MMGGRHSVETVTRAVGCPRIDEGCRAVDGDDLGRLRFDVRIGQTQHGSIRVARQFEAV